MDGETGPHNRSLPTQSSGLSDFFMPREFLLRYQCVLIRFRSMEGTKSTGLTMNKRSTHIVLVEDDAATSLLVSSYLEKAGYLVSVANSSAEFYSILVNGGIDLILLDLNLPDGDGMEIARRLRKDSDIPIIIVSVRDKDADRIAALELGVDDYLTKPFHPRELVARVRNLLHRVEKQIGTTESEADGIYAFSGFTIDIQRRLVTNSQDQPVALTRGEFDLLASLVTAAGRVLSRDQLINAVSTRNEPPQERTIDVMISRLRNKLASDPTQPDLLITVPGKGYQLVS